MATSLFSKIAESPTFIAFQAHCWFAAFLTHVTLQAGGPRLTVVACYLAAAALKEFYIDVHYETDPPQTYTDGLVDFAGYAVGVAVGVL